MNLTSIRTLYKDMGSVNRDAVTVGGWVRSIRASKAFGFIVLSDGTYFQPLQVVYHDKMANFSDISKTIWSDINGTSISVIV